MIPKNTQPILVVVDMHTAFKPPMETIFAVIEMIDLAYKNNIPIINLIWKEKRDVLPMRMVAEVETALKFGGEYTTLTKDENDGSKSILDHFEGKINDKYFIFCGVKYQFCVKETIAGMNTANHLIVKEATDFVGKPDDPVQVSMEQMRGMDFAAMEERANFQYNIEEGKNFENILVRE